MATLGIFLLGFLSLFRSCFQHAFKPYKSNTNLLSSRMDRLEIKANWIEDKLETFQSDVKRDFEKVNARMDRIEDKLDKALKK